MPIYRTNPTSPFSELPSITGLGNFFGFSLEMKAQTVEPLLYNPTISASPYLRTFPIMYTGDANSLVLWKEYLGFYFSFKALVKGFSWFLHTPLNSRAHFIGLCFGFMYSCDMIVLHFNWFRWVSFKFFLVLESYVLNLSSLKVRIMQDFSKQFSFYPRSWGIKVESENKWSHVDVSPWNKNVMSLSRAVDWILISRNII